MNRRCVVLLVCSAALFAGACDAGTGSAGQSDRPSYTILPASSRPLTAQRPPSTFRPRPTTTTALPPPAPAGKVVVLDPGHNGGNGAHPEVINREVPAGRGMTKACNTTGTSTSAGYPEHAFTFDVALRVRKLLLAKGFRVAMTRSNDTGAGPCVNERAALGNRLRAAAVVSIHGDGNTSASARGFHVAYSWPPLNAAQSGPSVRLATALRDGMVRGGFATSNYLGSAGLDRRDDLGGLNLATVPTALVECGNMRSSAEAASFTTASGRQRYATALATAITAYLT